MFPRSDTLQNLALPVLASAIVLLSGTTALRDTDPRGQLTDLFEGSYQRTFEDRLDDALPFRTLAQQGWTAIRMAALGEVQHGALLGKDGWLFTLEEFTSPSDAPDFEADVASVRDTLAARNIALVPVIVPDKARIMADQHDFPRGAALEARFDRALGVLSGLGLPAIDTRQALAPLGQSAFLRTDTHWTPEGARAVARLVADQMPTLVEASGTYQTRATEEVALDGDLFAFADTGPFQSFVGPTPETLSRFETEATASDLGLFGDPVVTIALVGTSFSARGDLHFEGFLKTALGQDVLNLATQGQGPFAPMRQFLASETLTSNPPKTVIWEIPERYINPRTLP